MAEPVFGFFIPLGSGHSPVDPGFGRPGGGWGNAVDPGFGHGGWKPADPGFGVGGRPIDPGFGQGGGGSTLPIPPPPPGYIDNSLPVYPTVPIYPTKPPVGSTLPELPPGMVWPPIELPGDKPPGSPLPPGKVLALVIVFGIGYRWAVLDLTAKPGPPTAQPK